MKKVMMVGLDPGVVDFSDPAYAAYPHLDAAVLTEALNKDLKALIDAGYDASMALWDKGSGAEAALVEALYERKPDCVMIGAGVRLNPRLTPLFETLVNLVHGHVPNAKLCFNTGPFDSAEAVGRQLKAD